MRKAPLIRILYFKTEPERHIAISLLDKWVFRSNIQQLFERYVAEHIFRKIVDNICYSIYIILYKE